VPGESLCGLRIHRAKLPEKPTNITLSRQNGLFINGEVLYLFMRAKKNPLAGILGIVMSSIWEGGSHAYST
jgi:hypothetical protein